MIYKLFFKRILDLFCVIIALPFFLIIFIPVAVLIKLEDNGPIFYNAPRLGRRKKIFKMYKFRSMKINAPDLRLDDGSTFNGLNDPRVTRIGRFLRETSIDEIPQILNVLFNDMSLIGPRPDVQSNEEYPLEYISFLNVKPGITGYNQAYFRNETNRLEKMKNDKYYADNVSFFLDVKILFKTMQVVVKREKTYRT